MLNWMGQGFGVALLDVTLLVVMLFGVMLFAETVSGATLLVW